MANGGQDSAPSGRARARGRRSGSALVAVALAGSLLAASPAGSIGGVDAPIAAGGGGEQPHALSANGEVHLVNGLVAGVESLVRFDDDTPRSLGSPAREIALSADGSIVATLDAERTLRVFDRAGMTVLSLPVTQPMSNLVVSGNGRFLGFAAPPADGRGLAVHRYDRSTGRLLVLPADVGVVTRPIDMTDDGGRVLVWRGADATTGQLGVFDVDALTLTKVTVEPVPIIDAAMTPDGSSVFFASSSALVGGVSSGVHLYQTTFADRLIQLAPVGVVLESTAEISPDGQIVAQRSTANPRAVQVIDRRTGRQWSRAIPGVALDGRVTPLEISDDGTTMLVDIETCVGSVCRSAGSAVAVPTGAIDPLALRWIEADRPLRDSLDRLYVAVTGRAADEAGRSFWLGRLVAGESLESVALGLLQSAEGQARFGGGLTPEAVIERAFSGILARSVTSDDIVATLAQANGRATVTLVVAVAQSVDAVEATRTSPPQTSEAGQLIRLYRAVFGRFPDALGYRYWAGQQASGLSLDAMIDSFAVSAEYAQRYGTNPSADVAITQLYRNVLDRDPDVAGAAYWRDQLANGASRNVMLHAFVDSIENISRTGTQP